MPRRNAQHTPEHFSPSQRRAIARRLLAWFARHQRDLPWRRTRDPFAIWVSEIMLQQTQVATVIPYFERFLAAFPDVQALAQAPEHDVLRLWEGLGYYRRARQLHRAAQVIVQDHAGVFPRDLAGVESLPGIGRYTAGAITSIAYDLPSPILEANTIRLFSRLAAFEGDTGSTRGRERLWQLAEELVPRRQAGAFNQALMELGSLVCTPQNPRCAECPLAGDCAAFVQGKQQSIPRPAAKTRFEAVREATVAVWRGSQVLMRQRAPGERWAGLWDFLRFPLSEAQGAALDSEINQQVKQASGLNVGRLRPVATIKHGVTRFRITLECFDAVCQSSMRTKLPEGNWRWVDAQELVQIPLSMTGRKFSKLLDAKAPQPVVASPSKGTKAARVRRPGRSGN